jgi:peptidoglycan/LPS O-acetylase OafA/YrhL
VEPQKIDHPSSFSSSLQSGAAVSEPATPPVRAELANLDTLRTFAVLCVLVDHATLNLNSLYFHNDVLELFVRRLGRLGVVAFFVHTSLVLMFSLQRLHKETPRPTLAFYLRRIFRIYPLSILVVILCTIFQIPDLPFGHSLPGRYSPLNIVSNLFLFQNIIGFTITNPLWSLPFEIQMYVFLPALYLLARRPGSTRVIAGLIAGFAVLAVTCYTLTGKLHFLAFIPCFLSGILAFSLRNRERPVVKAAYWSFYVPLLLVLASIAGVVWSNQEYIFGWLLSFCLGGTVYLFHDSTSRVWNAITKNVAKYSYGLYLLHVPSLWLVFKILGITDPVIGTATWLVVVSLASFVTFHVVEDPMIRFGKKLTKKIAGTLKARSVSTLA